MQVVLNSPMTARQDEQALRRIGVAEQMKLTFRGHRTSPFANAATVDAADGCKAGPAVVGQPGNVGGDASGAKFHSPMPSVGVLVLQDRNGGVAKKRSHVVEHAETPWVCCWRRLVAFQGHDVARSSLVQQLGAGALGMQRVHRHVAPAQVQQPEQFRQGGGLVGLAVHGDLADAQADVGGERVQQVKGLDAAPGIRAAAHGLAVDGDLARRACGDTPGEVGEHRLELLWLDQPQQPPERVVGRRAVLIGQITPQDVDLCPGELCPGELRVAVAAPEPAQRGAKRRKQDLRQPVGGPADDPRIVDPGEKLASGWTHGARP